MLQNWNLKKRHSKNYLYDHNKKIIFKMTRDNQTRAMVTLYGRLKYDAALACNLSKEFTGRSDIKRKFTLISNKLNSMLSDFTSSMNNTQVEAFRKSVNEERTAQLENIINLLQGVPQSNLEELEDVLIEINEKYKNK